jgi:hypothetical protein
MADVGSTAVCPQVRELQRVALGSLRLKKLAGDAELRRRLCSCRQPNTADSKLDPEAWAKFQALVKSAA